MIIDELIAILGYDVRGEGELAKFNQGLDRAAQRAQVAANRINAISVAIGTFAGQAAYGAITRLSSAIGSFPGQVIEVGKTFEALQIRLETLEGSAEKADKAMAWIRQFAKDTPLELAQVADAYADLKNFGLDPTAGSLQALTDAMSASGKGTQMLGRLTLAIGQAWVKQKLQGQEILQLTEAGIPVWDMLAEATGKNVQQLQKLSEKGQLGRKEIQLLIDAIQNKYVGASERFSKSFEGIASKLSDEWTEFLALIGEKGFYDDAKRRLEGMFQTVQRWSKDGILDRAATVISNYMTGVMDVTGHIGGQLLAIGRGALQAADGIVELISRVTGLNKVASAGLLGAGLIGATGMGRAFLAGLARRLPMVGALLLVDDILTGVRGGDSYIGKLEGGQEALDSLRTSWEALGKAASELNSALGDLFAFMPAAGSFFADPGKFINEELVRFVRELSQGLRDLAAIANALSKGDFATAASIAVGGIVQWKPTGEGATSTTGDKSGRLGAGSTEPDRRRFGAGPASGTGQLQEALANYVANMRRADGSGQAVVEDHSQDNRNQSVNVSAPVNVSVTTVQQAAASAVAGVGEAIASGIRSRSQLEQGPATP